MNKKTIILVVCSLMALPNWLSAQAITKNYRVVNTAVPFLTFSPDSRGASLGDAGAASGFDANSIFWNTSKLAFAEKSTGLSFSYAPWLRNLTGDMGLINGSYFKKVNKTQAFTFGLTYFNQGLIQFTTESGQSAGDFQSREFVIAGGYTRKLAQDLSAGINIKYINSNLIGEYAVGQSVTKPGKTVAGDLGLFYKKDRPTAQVERGVTPSFGLVFQNIGGKINYGRDYQYFIPANLKLGTNINIRPDVHNTFNILLDFNKLMVPTPGDSTVNYQDIGSIQGIFRSFGDAPGGFKEELQEITTSVGIEYLYDNLLALRSGFFYESPDKGGRRYITTGLGFRLKQNYSLDLAYLIPINSGSPLANTWRLTFLFDLNAKNKVADEPEEVISN